MKVIGRHIVLLIIAALCVSTGWAAKAEKDRAEKKSQAVKAKAERTAESNPAEASKQQAEKGLKGAAKKAQDRKAAGEKTADKAGKQAAEKADRAKARVEGSQQQVKAVAEKLTREQQKHTERQVRLERMLQVAQEKGDEKAVERIQSLIEKEKSRYERKLAKTVSKQNRAGTQDDAQADENAETEQ